MKFAGMMYLVLLSTKNMFWCAWWPWLPGYWPKSAKTGPNVVRLAMHGPITPAWSHAHHLKAQKLYFHVLVSVWPWVAPLRHQRAKTKKSLIFETVKKVPTLSSWCSELFEWKFDFSSWDVQGDSGECLQWVSSASGTWLRCDRQKR